MTRGQARLRMQRGQAVAEALAVLLALGSLWVGVLWLGRVQDAALQLSHDSRRAAFAHAHQEMSPAGLAAAWAARPSDGATQRLDRRGAPLLAAAPPPRVEPLPGAIVRGPGDPYPGASVLRQDLALGDAALWRAEAGAQTRGVAQPTGALWDVDLRALSPRRQTVILRGAGAATGDASVQAVLGASGQAWARQARSSRAAGRQAAQRLQGVDEAWGRALPDWDWLSPWTAAVPAPHLHPGGQP